MQATIICNSDNYISIKRHYDDLQEIEIWLKENGNYKTYIRHQPFEKITIYAPFPIMQIPLRGHRLRIKVLGYEKIYVRQIPKSHCGSREYHLSGVPVVTHYDPGHINVNTDDLITFLE